MRSKLLSVLTVIGALTVLVLAGNTVALATTGKAILAGKINTASKMTSLTRTTSGTGLQVKTKSTANAPLAVNGTGKVVNFNADKLDGLDSTAFAAASRQPIAYGYVTGGAGGTNPALSTGSTGVTAVTWDAVNSRYLLTLTGGTYIYNHYATTITGSCPGLTPRTDSAGNKLVVAFDSNVPCATGGFAYVIYKLS
ncbi:MAG: hypothetical protein ACJ72L_09685 [Marmoricola sp.]